MSNATTSASQERLTDLAHLSAGIGHHVINAFSAIVSNAEILRLSAQMPEAVDPMAVADVIIRTAVDASSVARRLIDFTRPSTAINFSALSLHDLITEVVDQEAANCRPGIRWATNLHDVPEISGNHEQLRAMLDHLIANAYEAIPASGGQLTITTDMDSRGWVVLELHDTGAGMPPEILQRAVEPFFTTKPGRFGVGLTIANGIWRRHRGTMSIQSEPRDGTLIRLFIEPIGVSGQPQQRA